MSATKSSPFKLIVFVAFLLFAAIGVTMFALFQAKGTNSNIGEVHMWGTIPDGQFNTFLNELGFQDELADNIRYFYTPESDFDTKLIEALASGEGPDIVILTNDQIMHHKDRMFITPYEQYDVRSFKNTYIDSAESLLLNEGIIALPVAIDPLVLYWNRTLLANNQYPLPPKQWNEIFKMSQKITRKNENGIIELSTIGLGEFSNITHAKDILIAMLMQAGGNVTATDSDGNQISTLSNRNIRGSLPLQDALRFYTEFSNPSKRTYTWNKSLPRAREFFISGDLAMYVGYASELPLILAQNPNLNFDVAPLPQLSGGVGEQRSTIARVYALAIPKVAYNPQGAGTLLNTLTSKNAAILFEKNIGLPSPQRELLAAEPKDPLKTTFRNSAIMAKSWRDPNPEATYKILKKMTEDVVSGTSRMSQAIARANRELQVLLAR